MELHTYAKRKSSKWSIDQKRKLVMARIKYDNLFRNQSASSMLPWKKVLELAKLNNYNVFFVRKQWSGMIAKYKQYKDKVPSRSIDEDVIKKISLEWEFFEPLHAFMTKRTTNLHSYALTNEEPDLNDISQIEREKLPETNPEEEDDDDEEQTVDLDYPTEIINAYSSDTNETEYPTRYTDHDFYSKNPIQQSNYSADASEDTQESTTVLATKKRTSSLGDQESKNAKTLKLSPCVEIETNSSEKVIQTIPNSTSKRSNKRRKPIRLRTIEDKYYMHKIKYDMRMERRIDLLLNIFGQIVKANFPNINVGALIDPPTMSRTHCETVPPAPNIVLNASDDFVMNGENRTKAEPQSEPQTAASTN